MAKLKINVGTKEVKTVEIENDLLAKAKKSNENLRAVLGIETLYDQIVEEFLSYRNKVDYWNVRTYAAPPDFIFFYNVRVSLNSSAFNLLNLGKLYLDKHFRDGKCFVFDITGDEKDKNLIESEREEIYQNNLGYVIACKLRNKSQHNSLPVKTIGSVLEYTSQTSRKKSLSLFLSYDELISMKVPAERISVDTSYDLTTVLNQYINAISIKHFTNRRIVKGIVEDSAKILSETSDTIVSVGELQKESILGVTDINDEPIDIKFEGQELYKQLQLKHMQVLDFEEIKFELVGHISEENNE